MALLLACPALAWAGWNPFAKRIDEPPVIEEPAQPAPTLPAPIEPLFGSSLPLQVGAVPAGLPSLSAQGCWGCHPVAHDGWIRSRHGAMPSAAFIEAVQHVATPACTACHLPLLEQHDRLAAYDEGIDRPVYSPNPTWQATLQLEGVTCAACHVRDGQVVAARAEATQLATPHPMAWSDELGDSTGCAACHQLTWPGADVPFYDTYGEWMRSPHADAGIGCRDCHMGAAADSVAPSHAMSAAGRAVSLLIDLPTPELKRGGDALPVEITLQNTGAGHAFPTGSPFKDVTLTAVLEGPPDRRGNPMKGPEPLFEVLGRSVGEAPPWPTTDDTRLPAGAERTWTWPATLPSKAARGPWALVVTLRRRVRGVDVGPPLAEHRLPLRVD